MPAPANDSQTSPQTIPNTSGAGTLRGTLVGATASAHSFFWDDTWTTSPPDVWYSFTLPANWVPDQDIFRVTVTPDTVDTLTGDPGDNTTGWFMFMMTAGGTGGGVWPPTNSGDLNFDVYRTDGIYGPGTLDLRDITSVSVAGDKIYVGVASDEAAPGPFTLTWWSTAALRPTRASQPEGVSIAPFAPLGADNLFVDDPMWLRLDTAYIVTGYEIDRGRTYELDKISTGTATIHLIDRNGDFDPTNTEGPFYEFMEPMVPAAIALQNPVTSKWSTLFRGYVNKISWVPYVTLDHANVTLELSDALDVLAQAEMVPDGSWGNSVDQGNIVFDEDLGTDAVQTRIGKVLDDFGWPSNSTGSDGVTNGTTTFTAASGSFTVADEGKFITIQTKGRYQILTRNSATNVTLSGTPSAGTSLAWTYGWRQINSGNVKLWETVYPPRQSVITPILDAADAEFPFGVACFYISKEGIVTFAGRQPRFNYLNVDYHIDSWAVGDEAAVASSPSTIVALSPPVDIIRDDTSVFNVASATDKEISNADLASGTQFSYDTGSQDRWGTRTWSTEGLVTAGGVGTTALQETKKFADYVVDTRSQPQTRVGTLTVLPRTPTGTSGPATWALLAGVELNDLVAITTTHNGGGGFEEDLFFVEGISYEVVPMNSTHDLVTLKLDVSPAAYFPYGYFT